MLQGSPTILLTEGAKQEGEEGSDIKVKSIKYNNLKEGNAIAIKIKAGEIVQINSITVPCVKYLWAIGFFVEL